MNNTPAAPKKVTSVQLTVTISFDQPVPENHTFTVANRVSEALDEPQWSDNYFDFAANAPPFVRAEEIIVSTLDLHTHVVTAYRNGDPL